MHISDKVPLTKYRGVQAFFFLAGGADRLRYGPENTRANGNMCASLESALINIVPPGLEEALHLARPIPASNCAVIVRWALQVRN